MLDEADLNCYCPYCLVPNVVYNTDCCKKIFNYILDFNVVKHCYACNKCVLNYDHHCIWINNCIGQKSYYYFSSFLISLIFNCCYKIYYLLQFSSSIQQSKELKIPLVDKFINKHSSSFIVIKYTLVIIMTITTIASV